MLGGQDPCPRYTARAPRSLGGDTLAVVVAGSCAGLETRPNVEVLVRPTGSGWQIENVRDPTEPSVDLLDALARYRAEQGTPPGPSTGIR